jgi:PPK2 family polyphosphate:nucleotide phosphotransferase
MAHPQHRYLATPGEKIDLAELPTDDADRAPGDKHATREETRHLVERIGELQAKLWAEADRKVLVVLQGIDTAGKGGTVDHVFAAVHPAGLQVTSFKAPSSTELQRDYLWRVHGNVPAKGELGVFDRSHYEDVLAVRVLELVPEAQWRRRYHHLVEFERMLVDEGTTIIKLFLHLSKDEQKARLQSRLDNPHKHWKFKVEDLHARDEWDAYQTAFEDAIHATSTEHAPWYVIPADRKWFRDWAVASIVAAVLESMDPAWPAAGDGLSQIVVR